jgi:hypothetical protein
LVYAAGTFGRMGNWPHSGLAAITPAETPVLPRPVPFDLSQNAPNPARTNTLIRFALPMAMRVSLSVYDIQGRRLAILLNHEPRSAGPHVVPVQVGGWRSGVYLYRIEAGGMSATRKMLVVR